MSQEIDLSIKQLLQNPTGSYTSYMASRARIKEGLDLRFNSFIIKHKKFEMKVFEYKKDKYLFYFKIPSESYDKLLYDVLIEIDVTPEDKIRNTIMNSPIKLFSNSPDFIFTYAYTLNQNEMIVPIVKAKINKKALTEEPKIKNPLEIYGFEKSCYYACSYIKQFELYKITQIRNNLFLFNKDKILKTVSTDAEKLAEYNKYKKIFTVKKKKEREASKIIQPQSSIKPKVSESKPSSIKPKQAIQKKKAIKPKKKKI